MGFFQQHNSEETVEEHRKKNPEKGSDKIWQVDSFFWLGLQEGERLLLCEVKDTSSMHEEAHASVRVTEWLGFYENVVCVRR